MQIQPSDTSCGPTCLQAVYAFFGETISVNRLIEEVPRAYGGGTLAVQLGLHALSRGFRATLYTYNLRVFDPSWFHPERLDLADKLSQEQKHRSGKRRDATRAYLDFVTMGGQIRFEDLTGTLIRKHLRHGIPILTGLSATFLYRTSREMDDTNADDDIRGEPQGHFVVLHGYRQEEHVVMVADPYERNPLSPAGFYEVPMERLINAILLGVLTYDGNLLMIQPTTDSHAPKLVCG